MIRLSPTAGMDCIGHAPAFDVVPGTNIVIPYDPTFVRDSFSPWIDETARDASERYKAYLYARTANTYEGGYLYTSPDGIHWKRRVKMKKAAVSPATTLLRCLSTTRFEPSGA